MKKYTSTFLMFCFFVTTLVHAQKTVSGFKLDAKLTIEGQELYFNGAGVREKMWMDLYVGSLYLDKKSKNAKEIVNSKNAVAIRLDVISSMVTSKKMVDALDEGLIKSTKNNIAPIKDKVAKFKSLFSDEIKVGDKFILVYVPEKGVVFYKNGEKKGVIEGYDFKKALFGIWLGDNPADEGLKEGLLGS
jgi:hypothetical protein